ncbi:MAG: hypothetical protein WC341_00580 [Bacteroidales bacterium]|jgi:hypothetical protein
MRKISSKEREKAGHIYCPFCKPKIVDAIWRKRGWYNLSADVACETHKNNISDPVEMDYTEADYQTWMRL